jgi:tetratricopeptide (TPR) repeat protein
LGHNSADQFFHESSRSRSGDDIHGRHARARMPSSAGYLAVVVVSAAALFFLLWWMLVRSGDEAPWLPAGLAASVVLLVALSAREVVMRRAWNRYLLDNGISQKHTSSHSSRSSSHSRSQKKGFSASLHSAALRTIQKQSTAADLPGATPEAHLDVAHLCHDYLSGTDEAMRSGSLGSEKGIAIRAGQERVRALHKHHLLTWARGHSRALTHEAQQRARTFDKIETANKALECIDSALRIYPNEPELNESRAAIGEFIVSVKVAHWVELAERSAFKGHYRRAIDRYRDALFYLNQDVVKDEVRTAGTEKIEHQIAELQSKLRTVNGGRGPKSDAVLPEDR